MFLELSDASDTNVGYSTLTDQDLTVIDKSENKLKLYGKRLVALEIVLTDGNFVKELNDLWKFILLISLHFTEKELKVVQPGKKEAYLRSRNADFPLYKFAGLQISGGSMLFYYDCEGL